MNVFGLLLVEVDDDMTGGDESERHEQGEEALAGFGIGVDDVCATLGEDDVSEEPFGFLMIGVPEGGPLEVARGQLRRVAAELTCGVEMSGEPVEDVVEVASVEALLGFEERGLEEATCGGVRNDLRVVGGVGRRVPAGDERCEVGSPPILSSCWLLRS